MGKYDPLAVFLASRTAPSVTLSFKEVGRILGEALPYSARNYREWWANTSTGHVNAQAWLGSGWRVEQGGVNLAMETVTFVQG